MNQPYGKVELLPCADCARAGRPGVVMQVLMYDEQWMNVSTTERDLRYPGAVATRTQRKKVRCVRWRCPHGHREQTVLE